MRRGFKAECERRTTDLRRTLQLLPHAPLPAGRLAQHLGVMTIAPEAIAGMTADILEQLLVADAGAWSGITIETPQGPCVIYNPSHSSGRHESDVMHEIAHLLLEHEPSLLVTLPGFPFPFRTFTEEQEEEARWLGATLQLPRVALLRAIKTGKSNQDIALDFGASKDQVAFRRQTTGVDRQLVRPRL